MNNKLFIRALEIAEKIRKEIPDFYCGFRTQNKSGRLNNGCYFQGNNGYAFIALVKEGSTINKTRAIGVCVNAHNIQLHVISDAKTSVTNKIFNDLIGLWYIKNIQKNKNMKKAMTKDLTEVELVSYIKDFKKYIEDKKIKNFLYSKHDFDDQVKKFVDKSLLIHNEEEDKYEGVPMEFGDSESKTSEDDSHEDTVIEQEESTDDENNLNPPLNLILYGPPGTGKTYNTMFKALEIIDGTSKEELEKKKYEDLKQRYNELKESGQIVFTTFHQSMSYEDFIEGIKPIPVDKDIVATHRNDSSKTTATQFGNGTTTIENLSRMKYEVRDGIFKKISDEANRNREESDDKGGNGISVQELLNAFCNKAEEKSEDIYLIKDNKNWHKIVPQRKDNENRDVQYFVIKMGSEQHLTFSIINRDWESFKNDKIKSHSDIKPKSGSQPQHGNARYYFALYKALAKFEKEYKPTQQKKVEKKNYVLIIDEINRGNVAQIFGELITLIEESKRLGNDEEMTATLPYSSTVNPDAEPFGVPNNLYIIGTMNTADRSVEALDTALRRRFSFEEMMPNPGLLGDKKVCDFKLSNLLSTINARIVALKDREHQIGHSYFMGCPSDKDDDEAKEWLKNVFKDKIIPLLQEYFYGDYKKIYYVLGGSEKEGVGFVRIVSAKSDDIFAVKLDDFDYDYSEKQYEIQSIDQKFNIETAINILIGKQNEAGGDNTDEEEQ